MTDTTDTYYESAHGVTITRERAMLEIKRHYGTEQDIRDFDAELGPTGPYDAQAVLRFLGY